MNLAAWEAHADDPKVQAAIAADPTSPVYAPIAVQFSRWAPLDWDNAVVGLHIVYGWMPTIPDFSLPAGLDPAARKRVVKLLNAARSRALTVDELAWLVGRFANNSIVGLSKLLHFVAPNRFPIWDSRVAKTWYAPQKATYSIYRTPEAYEEYCTTLTSWLPATVRRRARLRALSPHLTTVSDLRIMELVAFHA